MSLTEKPHSSAHTDPGRKRKQNQDSIHMDEIASAIACEEIPQQIAAGVQLEEALRCAHRKIVQRGSQQPELRGLGTTVVVVRDLGTDYEIAWSGDSRIYRWRHGKLVQRSEDHSIVQRMLKSGLISEQQAKVHPHQHVISSCLGSTSNEGLEIGYQQDTWEKDDWLLLCSDGLTDELDDTRIASILSRHKDRASACDALLQAALDAGGRDNVSVALIEAPADAPAGIAPRKSLVPWLLGAAAVLTLVGLALLAFDYWQHLHRG